MSTYQQKFGLEFEPQSNRPPSKQCGFVDVDVDSTVTLLWHCGLVDLWTVDSGLDLDLDLDGRASSPSVVVRRRRH